MKTFFRYLNKTPRRVKFCVCCHISYLKLKRRFQQLDPTSNVKKKKKKKKLMPAASYLTSTKRLHSLETRVGNKFSVFFFSFLCLCHAFFFFSMSMCQKKQLAWPFLFSRVATSILSRTDWIRFWFEGWDSVSYFLMDGVLTSDIW